VHSIEHGDCAVEDAQRPLDLRRKIDVAGGVNDVDSNVPPEAGGRRGGDGDAALLLLLHPVHRRRAFMDLPDPVRPAGVEKDALRRSGLAGIDVGHDADVPATL
jgi:hypothetical protein